MITDLNKKVKKITVDGITMELKPMVLGGEYNLESVLLEGGTQKIVATKAGVVTSGKYFVRVIDYDGTVLKEVNASTGDVITLPNAPSHKGLIFQEWSSSQEIVDNTITIIDNNVMVGATYTTASGLNEFDIELTKVTGLDVTLNMNGTKDWGDGISDDLTTHTYTDYGKYTIKCNGTTMTTSSSGGLFGQTTSAVNYYCTNVRLANVTIGKYAFAYCNSLINVVISNNVTIINEIAFSSCYSLKNIIIPNNVTSINQSTFVRCFSLTTVVIPYGVKTISNNVFQYCYSLTTIVFPNSVTSTSSNVLSYCYSLTTVGMSKSVKIISSNTFQYCYSLPNLVIPNSVTSVSGNAFSDCCLLTNIKIPDSVTSIASYAFRNCYSLTTYDFSDLLVVPTLENTSAFTGINGTAKIIVPDALYDEWIVATNWATYADYIYKASEVQ